MPDLISSFFPTGNTKADNGNYRLDLTCRPVFLGLFGLNTKLILIFQIGYQYLKHQEIAPQKLRFDYTGCTFSIEHFLDLVVPVLVFDPLCSNISLASLPHIPTWLRRFLKCLLFALYL
jgi:hypothetical protein